MIIEDIRKLEIGEDIELTTVNIWNAQFFLVGDVGKVVKFNKDSLPVVEFFNRCNNSKQSRGKLWTLGVDEQVKILPKPKRKSFFAWFAIGRCYGNSYRR